MGYEGSRELLKLG